MQDARHQVPKIGYHVLTPWSQVPDSSISLLISIPGSRIKSQSLESVPRSKSQSQLPRHSPLQLWLLRRRAAKGRAKDLIIELIHRVLDKETINNDHDGSSCLQPSQDRQECLFARTFLSDCNAVHSSFPRAFAALSVINCCVDALKTT